MGLRQRRQERREERRGGGPTTYLMRQRLVSIGDDYWVEDQQGNRAYKVDGKALRVRDTLILEDPYGHELFKIQERKLRVRDTMEVQGADGRRVATVKKAMISPFRDRFSVDLENGGELEVHGNVVDHEYRISSGRGDLATVSKKWFRVADTYGVEVAEGQDPALMLALAVVVDQMAHPRD